MHNQSHLLVLISLLALSGCATLVDQSLTPARYRQPALFNPLAVPNDADPKVTTAKTSLSEENTKAVKLPIFEVTSPSTSLIANNDTTYDLIVKDNSCDSGKYPTVTSSPFLAIGTPGQTGIQYNYRLKIPKAVIPDAKSKISLTIRSCSSTDKSDADAQSLELIKTSFLTASNKAYIGLSAKLNVWSEKDTSDEFGPLFSSYFYAADAVFVNKNEDSILVYGSDLTAKVRFRVAEDDVTQSYCSKYNKNPSDSKESKECLSMIVRDSQLTDRFDWKEDFRPMSFSDILAIFTYNQEADPRKRQVELLKSLGKILTGATVFTSSIDATKGVAFLTGIVLPEYEKQALWDMLLHVKNLESRSLKEVEEVHGNGQLHRVVFFPKRAISGVLPELAVYIAEIRPDEAKVNATVIKKEATLSSNPL